jgi:hypothetical protein
MKRRNTLQYTLTAAVVAGALAVSPAFAVPIDRVDRLDSVAPVTSPHQDLRGEHAQDAARQQAERQDLRGEHAKDAARTAPLVNPGPPTWPTNPQPIRSAELPAGDGDDSIWLVLGIGLAGAGIGAAGAAGLARHSRVRARRVTA